MKIGVLGCGRMASAVVEGMQASGIDGEWVTYTPGHTRALSLASKVGGRAIRSLAELESADMVIIGCKPYQFPTLARELVERKVALREVVSIMAAVSMADIQTALKVENVTRLMPSLPMQYGEGISLLCYTPSVGSPIRQFLHRALKSCSKVFELESEDLLDKLTLVAASGPAYVYYLAGAFEELLNRWQGDEGLSREVAVQLFKGSAVVMEHNNDSSLEELIAGVTSKKGVTMEAMASFQKDDLKGVLRKGVDKAWQRMVEIRKNNVS